MITYQIIITGDGSHTLYLPVMGEQYHSLNGAITEAKHVFIEKGYLCHNASNPVVFEVGLGTGLNCLLTAFWAQKLKRPTTYYAVEKYPLDPGIIKQLNYAELVSEEAFGLFQSIHESTWGEYANLSPYFKLHKMDVDMTKGAFQLNEKVDMIYFDAFGPDKQQEMWTQDIFNTLYKMAMPCCIFVTYSAKGEVRRRLSAAGFKVEKLAGPSGKKEMLRGIKIRSNI